MPGTVIETHDDGTPYLTVWRADDPGWPFKFGADLEAMRYVPEPEPGRVVIIEHARPTEPGARPAARAIEPPAAPTPPAPLPMPLGQRLKLLVAGCDYRGEPLMGRAVGGCGCTETWHCAAGKGLPMTPNEVDLGTCYRCVQGKE